MNEDQFVRLTYEGHEEPIKEQPVNSCRCGLDVSDERELLDEIARLQKLRSHRSASPLTLEEQTRFER